VSLNSWSTRGCHANGGRLVIQTASVDVDEAFVDRTGLKSGLVLSRSRHRLGMTARFGTSEPFFTTKERGSTAWSATVYGSSLRARKDLGYSELGQERRSIYLPDHWAAAIRRPPSSEPASRDRRRCSWWKTRTPCGWWPWMFEEGGLRSAEGATGGSSAGPGPRG
jgi:hypothetical protein